MTRSLIERDTLFGADTDVSSAEPGLLEPAGNAPLAKHLTALLADPIRRRAMARGGPSADMCAFYGLDRLADVHAHYRNFSSAWMGAELSRSKVAGQPH
jgi:hypothetical protein